MFQNLVSDNILVLDTPLSGSVTNLPTLVESNVANFRRYGMGYQIVADIQDDTVCSFSLHKQIADLSAITGVFAFTYVSASPLGELDLGDVSCVPLPLRICASIGTRDLAFSEGRFLLPKLETSDDLYQYIGVAFDGVYQTGTCVGNLRLHVEDYKFFQPMK